ncbi:MAG: hypothetical protein ACQESR_06195 [Planctomycetota bacterium]
MSELYTATPECDGIVSIALNGSEVTPPVENGYAVIRRKWKAGDKIELTLPMDVQRVKAIDKVEATRGQVALQYGPLVYCVEGVDQKLDKSLDSDASLTTEWKPDLLGGVKVIQGEWADDSSLTAIPYYARANRGIDGAEPKAGAPSTVWLKDE